MCGAPNPSSAGGGNGDLDYVEKLRRLQVQIRDSETKRMMLERKMLEYSESDTSVTKLKHVKLKKYLKEICERQKKSLLRNQDLLKEFDGIEACIRKFASCSESLQKLKAEYEQEIKSRLILQKNNTLKGDVKQPMAPEGRQAGINTRTAMSRGLYHTATIFMGRQMSAVSSAEDLSSLQKSSKLTKSFSISDPHSCRQPSQSGYMTDSCVVQTNSDLQRSNKSDKIDGKTYLPMGEEMPVTFSASDEDGRTCRFTVESKTNNCSGNFVESKMSPELNSLLHGRLSPENRTTDFKSDSSCRSAGEILTYKHSVVNEQGSKRPISLVFCREQLVSGNEHSRDRLPVQRDGLQMERNTLEEEDENSDGSSDLTISLSEEEEEINLLKEPPNVPGIGSKMSLKSVNSKEVLSKEEHHCLQTILHRISSEDSSVSPERRECLSFEGFSHVLMFIEEFVAREAPKCLMLYQGKPVNTAELETLISLCNQTGSLEQEDLELCEALVLHQLQRLLQNPPNGCLLSEKMCNNKSRMLNEKQARSELPPYFAVTWERISKHVLFLQKYGALLGQEARDAFSTLLLLNRDEQSELAMPGLQESFPEICEDRSLAFSNETSSNSQTNSSKIKQEKPAQSLDSKDAKEQEVASWCEDESKEESLMEKIPITGLNIDGSGLKERKSNGTSSEASFSSQERRSPLSRDENQRVVVNTTKSRAFWGDSDDSNSDIEAALRPQVHCSREDEFDDFYD
ncbi:centrosomal protein kizuna [Tiliqua scincoides]|uniref:centrosomal protein kizuna n=1 Tax=Tiliqua scincoides TaxID=71010 RepID=UPI0034620108